MISIVTATYNRETLVQATIKSILSQTYQDWEMIIVDDGSTDNTEQVIQTYLSDSRIKYFKKKNTGQPDTLNVGVGYASGEFIVFLDSDDEAYPNWLEEVSKEIKEDTGIVCVGAMKKLLDGTMLREDIFDYEFNGERMKVKFTCGSLFIRKTLFQSIGGYDTKLRSTIQTDLGYRLLAKMKEDNLKVVSVEKHLVQINIHAGPRIRTNWEKVREGGIQFLNKHYDFIYHNNKKEIANICSVIAFSNYKLKKRKESMRYMWKAIKHNPAKTINYLRLVKYSLL